MSARAWLQFPPPPSFLAISCRVHAGALLREACRGAATTGVEERWAEGVVGGPSLYCLRECRVRSECIVSYECLVCFLLCGHVGEWCRRGQNEQSVLLFRRHSCC